MSPGNGRGPFYVMDTTLVICLFKAALPINKQYRWSQWFMWLNIFVNPLSVAIYLHYGFHVGTEQ